MGSVTSEDPSDPGCNVSESETSSEFSGRRFFGGSGGGASSSMASSPMKAARAAAMMVADAEVMFWDGKLEKRATDFTGGFLKKKFCLIYLRSDDFGSFALF